MTPENERRIDAVVQFALILGAIAATYTQQWWLLTFNAMLFLWRRS